MAENIEASGPWPLPDDETYIRVVQGVLSREEAKEQLGTQPSETDCFVLGFDLNPITLGLLAAFEPFAEWYTRRFPERRGVVEEIRSVPEEAAFREIREGRWLEIQEFDADGRPIDEHHGD